jgi:hypothetical protein
MFRMQAIAVAGHFNVVEHLALNPFPGRPGVSSFLTAALNESGTALSKQVAACPTAGTTLFAKARSLNVSPVWRDPGPEGMMVRPTFGRRRSMVVSGASVTSSARIHMVGRGAVDHLTHTIIND